MCKVEIKLTDRQVLKLIDVLSEKGSDLVSIKNNIESKGISEISSSIIGFIDSEINECADIRNILINSRRGF